MAKTEKRGRPKFEFDLVDVKKLAQMQATDEEIADWFGCCKKTLQRAKKTADVGDAIERGRSIGRISLRRLQMESAKKGSVPMQIFLGKVVLGQKETTAHEISGKDGERLSFTFKLDNAREDD